MPAFFCTACGMEASLQNFARHQATNHIFCQHCSQLCSRRHACFAMSLERSPEPGAASLDSLEACRQKEAEVRARLDDCVRPAHVFVPLVVAADISKALCKVFAARQLGKGSQLAAAHFVTALLRDGCIGCRAEGSNAFHSCQSSAATFLQNNLPAVSALFDLEECEATVMKEALREVYTETGEAGSWSTAGQLYREARRRGLRVSRREAEELVAEYPSNTLYRRGRRLPLHTFAATLDQKWQLDLGFYPAYKGYQAFLICVDVLSRRARLALLKGKTSEKVAKGLADILEAGDGPSYVVSDRGTEFQGAAFQDLLARHSIHHYYANPPYKAALALGEYVIGRLKESEGRLEKGPLRGRDWPSRLRVALRAYNRTPNSRTGLAPDQVTPDNANRVFRRLFKPFGGFHKAWPQRVLPIGSPVRLRLQNRGSFAKTNSPRNSAEVFVVGKIRMHPSAGIKYKLFTREGNLPIAGTWNLSEIVPIKVPQV